MSKGTQKQDNFFAGAMKGAGIFIVVVIASIGIFLLWNAIPALQHDTVNFFTYDGPWSTDDPDAMEFGISNLFWTTIVVSLVALILALPISLGISLFLSMYCPQKLKAPLVYTVDLLAAVPSIVYGIWGAGVLGPFLGPVFKWISVSYTHLTLPTKA